MTAAARHGRLEARRHGGGGVWAAALVVAILAMAIWGAWRLGVMAGGASWRESLPAMPQALRNAPMPKPPPLPTQRRPTVELALRA